MAESNTKPAREKQGALLSLSISRQNIHPVRNGGVFYCLNRAGNTHGSHVLPMPQDTRIALFLMGELVAALRANDPDLFKRWLYGGIEDLGEPAVTELLLDWLDPFLTVEEQDRLLGWHLGSGGVSC